MLSRQVRLARYTMRLFEAKPLKEVPMAYFFKPRGWKAKLTLAFRLYKKLFRA